MAHRLAALPVLALLLGSVDTLLVRREFDHRPLGLELFWQTTLLWAALGALALIPGYLWRWLRERRAAKVSGGAPGEAPARSATGEVASQLAWTAGPVILHMGLNKHTSLGGDLSGLLSLRAVLDVGLAILVLVAMVAATRFLLARLGSALVATGALAAAVGLGGFVKYHEETHAAANEAASPDRPNVLLMIWDTSRAKSQPLSGYSRETTPRLAELGETSVYYKWARSVSSYTLTSHLSMLTGVYPSHHGARLLRQIYDPFTTPSVAQDFAAAGYRTGAFVGTSVLAARTGTIAGFEVYDDLVDPPVCDTRAWALVHDVQAVLAKLPGMGANGLPHWFQDFQRPATEVLANAAEWIERPDPRPWFCMINMYDVHWPYLPGDEAHSKWVEPYDGPATGYLFRANSWEDGYDIQREDRQHVKQLYDAEMYELDRRVGAFLDELDLDRTAVLVTSDHGEAFGEGGEWEHNDILECQVRVPLLVRPAGGVEGRVDDTPSAGVDVAPTLLDLAGLLDGVEAEWEGGVPRFFGHSLLREPIERPILVEDRDHPDPDDVRLAIYWDRWKVVRLGVGDEAEWELHDLRNDPNALRDVARFRPDIIEKLGKRLMDLRESWGASDERDAMALSATNLDALIALGYMEGAEEDDPEPEPGPQDAD